MESKIHSQIVNQINESWSWSGIRANQLIESNNFGNVIFTNDKEEFYRICPEELSIEKIALNKNEFEILKKQDDFILDWEMLNLVKLAKSEMGELDDIDKYCLKIPAVISSNYSKENIGKISFQELIAVSGDLAFQIKDLEDGQRIELKIID